VEAVPGDPPPEKAQEARALEQLPELIHTDSGIAQDSGESSALELPMQRCRQSD
jgi:hypothetical protein